MITIEESFGIIQKLLVPGFGTAPRPNSALASIRLSPIL
jgi:hypothetical protein